MWVVSNLSACFSDDSTTSNQDQFWINYWPNSTGTTIPAGLPAGRQQLVAYINILGGLITIRMCPVKLTCHIIFAPVIKLMRLVVEHA